MRADHHRLAGQGPAAGHDPGHVLGSRERRPERDARPVIRNPGTTTRARPEVAVHVFLEPPQVDARRAQPPFGNAAAHLEDGNSSGALRAVVAQDGKPVLFVLQGAGHEHDCGRAALARLVHLVAHRRPSARPAPVEGRALVPLLRLVAQDEDDLCRGGRVLRARGTRRAGPRSRSPRTRARPRGAGAGHPEGNPGVDRDTFEGVALTRGPRPSSRRSPGGSRRGTRGETDRTHTLLDPVRGAAGPGGAQAPAFHLVRREHARRRARIAARGRSPVRDACTAHETIAYRATTTADTMTRRARESAS